MQKIVSLTESKANTLSSDSEAVYQKKNMSNLRNTLDSPIEYLKGVGPVKGDMLKKELGIHTFGDLLRSFPFRYVDKTKFHKIRDINNESNAVQLKGVLRRLETKGDGRAKRLVGRFRDDTGVIELVWFKGVYFLE
ncbi:MAG: ATP-dependent DNA helicase RecG, partial [Granulosicoccus sp.]